MKSAIEGIYSDGKIVLNENINYKGKAKVLVVFLENINEKKLKKERLLSTFGSWQDERTPEEILNEIYSARVSRNDEIVL
ncbi:MAG: hypothetical protein RO469_07750 [Thermincola sp.]|nr:hypothetical protein [Thermincola sp.]MDT3704475.1 hypothetical protein [Thermincola sp.]